MGAVASLNGCSTLSINRQSIYINPMMRTEEPRPVRLQDYRPPDWLIETVDLDISLHPTAARIRSKLKVKPNAKGAPAPLVLDGEELKLVSLMLDGKPLPQASYAVTPERLTIAQPPQRPFELEIETVIDPAGNTQLMGLYRAGETYCTQCEAEGFRRITYFLDRPDVMAVYTTRVEADRNEAPVLLSNGNTLLPMASTCPGAGRHFAVWHDPFPKPSYLFAMVVAESSAASTTLSPPCQAARSRSPSMSSRARRIAASTPWTASSVPCAGTRTFSAANTISTFS